MRSPVLRVISGGQTGVDRAALDAALALGIPCGGWCPAGRWAEDGPIPLRYPLRETPSGALAQRTRWNVRDSEATLILVSGPLGGGTALTRAYARELLRPCLVVDPYRDAPRRATIWLRGLRVNVLNVAGPRESESPGIQHRARHWLWTLLRSEPQNRGRRPPEP